MHDPLMSAILNDEIESALYETGSLLKASDIATLERTWIHILSIIGETVTLQDAPEYQRCIMHTLNIVRGSDVMIKDAFLLTTRLLLMSRRHTTMYARPDLKKMRNNVMDMFPETASLNNVGFEMFKGIMPPVASDEHVFVHRIIAGLTKVWSEKRYDDSRLALEYLTRKKFAPIPKPKCIMPSLRDDNDIVWVLWGVILNYFQSDIMLASYELFTKDYRKQLRNQRLGILWSMFFLNACSYNERDDWKATDYLLYQRVEESVENLWQQVIGNNAHEDGTIIDHVDDFWVTYFPRITKHMQVETSYPFKEESRLLRIKESKR